jgi:hypothetical protein
VVSLALASAASAQTAQTSSSSLQNPNWQRIDGYMPLYWDAAKGKLYLEISRFDQEFLYQVSLATGVGSNPIGLDRGQMGPTAIVKFERIGPKVLLVQPNYTFRALNAADAEQRAVADSFATSVLWGFTVEVNKDDRVIVDATAFFLHDAHGVADRLKTSGQGSFRLDESRSAIFLPRTKGFPKNTEVEATLTFQSDAPGPLVRQTTPSPEAVTVREHHSFVELPPPGYQARSFDPRVGFFPLTTYDYASPITSPLERRLITRHRLEKKDPSATKSEPVEPVVYYVDNGAPEPIRQALVDGASWWNQAFEAAGFINAFQVKVLPPDADPMDIRYNMINWVHRSSRGWSYGGGVTDPRTGEIIKGNVTLGSLRIRQDILIGAGLMAPYSGLDLDDGPEITDLVPDATEDDVAKMSLARIRQLAAHEVGHTLGLEHNFAASTYGRASVMDYPAPYITLKDGALDLSEAYAKGLGSYDLWAIQWGYGADERTANAVAEDGVSRGLRFVDDNDSRSPRSGHPLGSLWDNGPDAVAELKRVLDVRQIALSRFGLHNLPVGAPVSTLEVRLLPLYLMHRYQIAAAAKWLGGANFNYSIRTTTGTSPEMPFRIVPADHQRDALAALLSTLDPSVLTLPPSLLAMLPPTAFGYDGGPSEHFDGHEGSFFDPLAAASVAADLTVSALLQPERAARLVDFHARDARNPDFGEVVGALVTKTFASGPQVRPQDLAIRRTIQNLVVTRLIALASSADASFAVRADARRGLRSAQGALQTAGDAAGTALREDIQHYLARPEMVAPRTPPSPIPPGEPIG